MSSNTESNINTAAAVTVINTVNAELQENYWFDYLAYQENVKMYNQEVNSIHELRNWINKTVSFVYQKIFCLSTSTVREWYNNFKNAVDQSDYQSEEQLQTHYQDAVKSLTKIPKDFKVWIIN